jgi:alanine racemase
VALRALATINLAAVERNVARLRAGLAGGAQLCAVVKADASSHGAVPVARAALAAGASSLAVATVGEAAELRAAGIDAPVLIMGAISAEELPVALAARGEVVAWTPRFVEDLAAAVGEAAPIRVHVKLDSGMGRLGTRSAGEALAVADGVLTHAPELVLAGAMTHFATADDDREFVARQLDEFRPFAEAVHQIAPGALVHAANSAAAMDVPESHFDMVRCGIAIYGCDPMHADPTSHGLEPALELTSYLAAVKPVLAGDSVGYGRRYRAGRETWIGTIPIGYGDGVRRQLTNNCDVLVEGRRYPLVGTVSMDNLTIDLGPEAALAAGARATIIGADGGERQTAEDLARRVGTISYEIVCGISARVPRSYHRDGVSES